MKNQDSIFISAKAIADPQARADYLTGACGADPALRERVEAMLRDALAAESFFHPTEAVTAETAFLPLAEGPGTIIGRYKLLQSIGEGGMGVVYMAEQEEPVRRRVALKVVKIGMDTKQVIARFEAERQALAMMDHPNIAKVLDAGATETGRPYFVMELVRGVPITEYCDKNHLNARQRLELFLPVCQAIQHAHQKGIIHRDIKPSNVMVTLHDGKPVPMVIDFGIAKATNQKLTEKTLFTQFATMVGTPAYMSPEQAEMSKLDVDTRSDVYSLGVLLYELLTGSTPFPEKRLRSAGYGEMQRIIAEEEPERPSTRLSTMEAKERTVVVQNRGADVGALGTLFRGDLDWIVMKCLEKDRARRYETANGLALDIERHLGNEPVVARPPSAAYRLQKAMRRNKRMFAAAAMVVVALALGTMVSTWQAVRATHAKADALLSQQAEAKTAELARKDRDRAVRAEGDAVAKAQAAEMARQEARRNLYAAEINGAFNALAENNLGRAVELMKRQKPAPGEEDLRGFEWRHLWQLCRSDEQATFDRNGSPWAMVFSPDGRFLASTEWPGISIRNSTSQNIITNLPFAATVLSFSTSQPLLAASCSWQQGVKFWYTDTWRESHSFTNAYGPARFSPDGRWFAAATTNGFQVWDAKSWKVLGICPGYRPDIGNDRSMATRNVLAFSPDGSFLVTPIAEARSRAEGWEQFRVWKVPSLDPAVGYRMERENIWSAAWTPDGKRLLTGMYDGTLVVWDATRGQIEKTEHPHTVLISAIATEPSGRTFVTGSSDRTMVVWNGDSCEAMVRLRGHQKEIGAIAFLPSGRHIASWGYDNKFKLWDAATGRAEATVIDGGMLIGFTQDSKRLVLLNEKAVKIFHVDSKADVEIPIGSDSTDYRGPAFAMAGPGPIAAMGRPNGMIEIWNLGLSQRLYAWKAHTNRIYAVALSRNGNQLAVATSDRQLALWSIAAEPKLLRTVQLQRQVCVIAFSRDGNKLATASSVSWRQDKVRLWDVDRLSELAAMDVWSNALDFSPDGIFLAASGENNEVKVWDVPSGKLNVTFLGHVRHVTTIAFSPDGKTFATGGRDGKVRLWHLTTKQELATFPAEGPVESIQFSSDGRMFAVCYSCSDGDYKYKTRIWRAPSWPEIEAAEKAEAKAP